MIDEAINTVQEQFLPTTEKSNLNLGCGDQILDGFLNVDRVPLAGIDAVVDLNKYPWPFKTGAWKKVQAYHILEHLDDVISAVHELHRILAPGGIADERVPHVAGWGTGNDLTHRHFFTRRSFEYFRQDHSFNYYYRISFKEVKCFNVFGVSKSSCLNRLMNPLLNTTLYDWLLWKIIACAEVKIILANE